MKQVKSQPEMAEYIESMLFNGLSGRILRLPSETKKKREMLLIYGQHASIERMFSFAQELSRYGNVTLPDLPGFGGMTPLYSIGKKPDLDTMADYLASFIKLKFKRKRLTIIGVSYGFIVATRMLQRYPDLAKKVDLAVSVAGLVHHDDFKFSSRRMWLLRAGTKVSSLRLTSWLFKHAFLRKPFIVATYKLVEGSHVKLKDGDAAERRRRVAFEVILWKINDIRTYMYSINGMLKVDLCDTQINIPVHHVKVDGDQYFDNYKVEQHMKIIYENFKMHDAKLKAHMPTIVADRKEIAPLIPRSLRRVLGKATV